MNFFLLALVFWITPARSAVITRAVAPASSTFICGQVSADPDDLQAVLRDRCEPGQPFHFTFQGDYRWCCISRAD